MKVRFGKLNELTSEIDLQKFKRIARKHKLLIRIKIVGLIDGPQEAGHAFFLLYPYSPSFSLFHDPNQTTSSHRSRLESAFFNPSATSARRRPMPLNFSLAPMAESQAFQLVGVTRTLQLLPVLSGINANNVPSFHPRKDVRLPNFCEPFNPSCEKLYLSTE